MVGVKGRSGGANRKPPSLHLLEGNPGHKRLHPKKEIPEPDLLPLPGDCTKELVKMLPRKEGNPFPKGTDRFTLWEKLRLSCGGPNVDASRVEPLLEATAEVWQEHRELREQIRDEGHIITDQDGNRRKNPLVQMCNQAFVNLVKGMQALGLSGDAIEILHDSDARPVNDLAEVMRVIDRQASDNPISHEMENRIRAVEIRKRKVAEG